MTIAVVHTKRYLHIVILLCILHVSVFGDTITSISYFIPPSGWKLAHPQTLAPKVTVGFIGKPRKGFCPSINLAIEHTQVSIKEYLKASQNIHENKHRMRWRKLGIIHTKAGGGTLTEIDTENALGAIRILQMILLKDQCAYILTAAALKEDFPLFYEDFMAAFRSFQLVPDLLSSISENQIRMSLEDKINTLSQTWESLTKKTDQDPLSLFQDVNFQNMHWIPFQKHLEKTCYNLGMHWQFLFLKDLQNKLISFRSHEPVNKHYTKSELFEENLTESFWFSRFRQNFFYSGCIDTPKTVAFEPFFFQKQNRQN